jgi:hypothetical protein
MGRNENGTARAALIAALNLADASPSERFDRIVRIAREVFGVPLAYVNLLDDELLHTLTPNVPDELVSGPVGWSFCQLTVRHPGPTVIPDTTADPRTADLPGVTHRGVRFYAGVPLTLTGGDVVGTLCLMDTRPRDFSAPDEAALIDFGRWAERALAGALDHDRLLGVVAALTPPPLEVAGYRIGAIAVPYGDVSGDLHDWWSDGEHLTVTLADVMGKEQPAALLAAGVRAALRQHQGRGPADAVNTAEPALTEDLGRAGAFATLFHARVALDTGVVESIDAGHGLVVHLGADGAHRMLRSHGLPLGLHHGSDPRTAGSIVLGPGDALIVASDGALDLGNGTVDTLADLARTFGRTRDLDAFFETVRLRSAERAEDDVTVIVLVRERQAPVGRNQRTSSRTADAEGTSAAALRTRSDQ